MTISPQNARIFIKNCYFFSYADPGRKFLKIYKLAIQKIEQKWSGMHCQ